MCPRSFPTIANPAGTFLPVVRRAVLAGVLAVRVVRCKGRGAKDGYRNRKQSLRMFNHKLTLLSASD
jgi:hypothetical protein